MTALSNLFGALLKDHIEPLMKDVGFLRRGQCFFREGPESWAIINFQRSSKSDSVRILFTVDLGVASKRVCEFFGIQVGEKKNIDTCQWRQRLGMLTPGGVDHWWSIDTETDIASLGSDLKCIIRDRGIPVIESLSEDAALMGLWMSGVSPGLTRAQRLMNLTALLDSLGPQSELRSVAQELRDFVRGRAVEDKANWVLSKLVSSIG